MNIILLVLLIIVGIIALLLIAALFMPKRHFVRREIIINAPVEEVFAFVRLLKSQEAFNKHATADADRKKELKGTDGTVGYVYSWSGDKSAGAGEKEIIGIIEGKRIESEIRFEKPMKVSARIVMETEALAEGQTKVYWSNAGRLNYPVNLFIPMMQRSVAKDMDGSLITLKDILEK